MGAILSPWHSRGATHGGFAIPCFEQFIAMFLFLGHMPQPLTG